MTPNRTAVALVVMTVGGGLCLSACTSSPTTGVHASPTLSSPAQSSTRAAMGAPSLSLQPSRGPRGTVIHLTAANCPMPVPADKQRGRFSDAQHIHGPAAPFPVDELTTTTATAEFRVPASSAPGLATVEILCGQQGNASGFFNVTAH